MHWQGPCLPGVVLRCSAALRSIGSGVIVVGRVDQRGVGARFRLSSAKHYVRYVNFQDTMQRDVARLQGGRCGVECHYLKGPALR